MLIFHPLSRLKRATQTALNTIVMLSLLFVPVAQAGFSTAQATLADEPALYRIDSNRSAKMPDEVPLAALPIIEVLPANGWSGQIVQVSGVSDPAYPNVRLAWWYSGATHAFAVAPVDPDGAFAVNALVPADADPGWIQICAALDGTERTEFNCADFLVETPPPGSLTGQIALSSPGSIVDAQFSLFDADGSEVVVTNIQPDGSFSLPGLPPGNYLGNVSGVLNDFAEIGGVQIHPGAQTVVQTSQPILPCSLFHQAAVSNIFVNPGVIAGMSTPSAGKTIGTFFSLGPAGQAVNVGFTPSIQVMEGSVITNVEFILVKPDGTSSIFFNDTSGPIWQAAYNVSLLPPGTSRVIVRPHVAEGCALEKQVNLVVLPDPMADPFLKEPFINYDYALKRYNFHASVPNAGGILPIVYPDPAPSIPLLGTLENRLDAGLYFSGYMNLNGLVFMDVARTQIEVEILNQSLYNQSKDYINSNSPKSLGAYQKAKLEIPFDTLISINKKTKIYSGPVVSFLGIVTLNASVSIGFNGSIKMWGWLKPIQPWFSMAVYPSISPYLPIKLWLTFIGIGIASLTGTTELTFGIPLKIYSDQSPQIYLDDPCFRIKFWLDVWIGIDYYFGSATLYSDTYHVINESWGNCPVKPAVINLAQNKPRIMSQPLIVNGPAESMLSVTIEDQTPTLETITPVVKARFWDVGLNDWGAPTIISDGLHYVTEPSATFLGPDGQAMIVWVQNQLSRQEGFDLGANLNAILSHQEIFYSVWEGTGWGVPQQLTNDALADANPSIAGDLAGGATLAWVTDTDGNIATRTDQDIFINTWTAPLVATDGKHAGWGSVQLLSANPDPAVSTDTAMDSQPIVIQPGDPDLLAAIAWTRDLDGEPSTNSDRRIVVQLPGRTGWDDNSPFLAPSGADSPTIAWDASQNLFHLAFLVRGKDEDGITDTGLGDQAVLWTARWNIADGWTNITGMFDEFGNPVRAEAPRLQVREDQEALLLFRRFDDPGTPGMYGNLALSLQPLGGSFSPPLYLTNTADQRWMQSMAVNSNGQLVILNALNVPPDPVILQPILNSSAVPSASTTLLAAGEDLVEFLSLPSEADSALDPVISLSELHPAPGTLVDVGVTVRNVGQDPASGLTVQLYDGNPELGNLLDSQSVPSVLGFNETALVTFQLTSSGGMQELFAVVVPPEIEPNIVNNQAAVDLGGIPAPSMPAISPIEDEPLGFHLNWMPPGVGGVSGYRILRSEAPGGPYELVGQSDLNNYSDTLVERGKIYYYVIQAYDAFGVYSPYSPEASVMLPLLAIYLPSIQR